MRALLATVLLLCGHLSFSQNDRPIAITLDPRTAKVAAPKQSHAPIPGVVSMHQSDRISSLMTDYASRPKAIEGYRVQIFLGRDRDTAESTRRAFLLKHPEIPTYLSYLAPNFRIRVGDLRDRVHAQRLRADLMQEFPGPYVVPDVIEPPRLIDRP